MREQSPARGDEEDIILMNPNKGYPDLQKTSAFSFQGIVVNALRVSVARQALKALLTWCFESQNPSQKSKTQIGRG